MKTTRLAVIASSICILSLLHARVQAQTESLAGVAARGTQQRQTDKPSKTYGDADLEPVQSDIPSTPAGGSALTEAGATPSSRGAEAPRADVVRAVMPAVVTIESGNSRGSGFFVAPGIVVTNRHVIAASASVLLRFSDGGSSSGYVSATATDADLALVHVDQPPASQRTLRMNPAASVEVGDEVLAVGSALGLLQGTVTRGIVSAVRTIGGLTFVQTDAAINPGNSGGPLVDRNGFVVGIATAKVSAAESLGFGIGAEHAIELLQGRTSVSRRDPGATSTGDSLDSELNAPARSQTDQLRERGLQRFEATVQALAGEADIVDIQWRGYRSSCTGKTTFATILNGREWFGIWGGQLVAMDRSLPECRALLDEIVKMSARIRAGMAQAEETARRAGVFPGSARAIRARHGMDWSGWSR